MIGRYRVLYARIQSELADIRRAADKAQTAFQRSKQGGPDESFYLDAAALNLHGFYNGVERLFEWIAREVDGTVPGGAAWHRELLAQMELAIPDVRPPVIQPATRARLEEYVRFRHIVRNLYTWDFAPDRISELVQHLQPTLVDLQADFDRFGKFLTSAGQADEASG